MKIIEDILKSKIKLKEKVILLSGYIKKDDTLIKELVECFKTGSNVEKGTYADVLKHVSLDKPELLIPYFDDLIEYINYKVPRVKWGVQESFGNMAKKFPYNVEKAIPRLLLNTKDESTVVRWCAAYALSEIAKYNSKKQKELLIIFSNIVKMRRITVLKIFI